MERYQKLQAGALALSLALFAPEKVYAQDAQIPRCNEHFTIGDLCAVETIFCTKNGTKHMDDIRKAKTKEAIRRAQLLMAKGRECRIDRGMVTPIREIEHFRVKDGSQIHVVEVNKLQCTFIPTEGGAMANCPPQKPKVMDMIAPIAPSLKVEHGTGQVA